MASSATEALKSWPLHTVLPSGMDVDSPRTADAETDGMLGFALTVEFAANGLY